MTCMTFKEAEEMFNEQWQLNQQEVDFIFLTSYEQTGGDCELFDLEKVSGFFMDDLC